jgi:hypothetical protein
MLLSRLRHRIYKCCSKRVIATHLLSGRLAGARDDLKKSDETSGKLEAIDDFQKICHED